VNISKTVADTAKVTITD